MSAVPQKKAKKLRKKAEKASAAIVSNEESVNDVALRALTDPAGSSHKLRESMASLYALNAQAGAEAQGRRDTRLAVSQIQANDNLSTEQLWGQLSVLYAPVLKQLEQTVKTSAGKVKTPLTEEERTERREKNRQRAAERKEARAARQQVQEQPIGEEGDGDEDDGAEDETILARRAARQARAEEKANKEDAWRYAFGMEGDAIEEEEEGEEKGEGEGNEEEEDEEDFKQAAFGDDAEGDVPLDEEDDGEYHERDFHEDNDEAGDLMDDDLLDEGEGLDSDADNEAALKEMYGEGNFEADDIMGEFDEEDEENPVEDEDDEGDAMPQRSGGKKKARGVRFEEEDAEGGYDDGQYGEGGEPFASEELEGAIDFPEEGEGHDEEGMTTFEKAERKRLREIQDLEETRLFEKNWTMGGEAAGASRPKDALLDETIEFDHAMKPVPVITSQLTEKLEERIKRRIQDGNFDDVQRRQVRTTAADLTSVSKRDEGIDAQKSKLSLMDLYEKEYLEKQKNATTGADAAQQAAPLTEVEKDELRAINMWKRLSQHLDALSNFFFTPKPVPQDMEARVRAVEGQAPAIALETVGVAGVASKESALAPQDLFRQNKSKFVNVSKEEMNPHEKRALRRQHKTSAKVKKAVVDQLKSKTAEKKKKKKTAEADGEE